MEISDLMLKKEDVPILYDTCFQVPIPSVLLRKEIEINPNLASEVFPQVAQEWYDDLKAHRNTVDLKEQTKKWYDNLFLQEKPKITIKQGHQTIMDGIWRDDISSSGNGFASMMSISRDGGGTIYFNEGEHGCEEFVPSEGENLGYIRISGEKLKQFGFEEHTVGSEKGFKVHNYSSHNIDSYPGALFLRNWGIRYINEALKSVL